MFFGRARSCWKKCLCAKLHGIDTDWLASLVRMGRMRNNQQDSHPETLAVRKVLAFSDPIEESWVFLPPREPRHGRSFKKRSMTRAKPGRGRMAANERSTRQTNEQPRISCACSALLQGSLHKNTYCILTCDHARARCERARDITSDEYHVCMYVYIYI